MPEKNVNLFNKRSWVASIYLLKWCPVISISVKKLWQMYIK